MTELLPLFDTVIKVSTGALLTLAVIYANKNILSNQQRRINHNPKQHKANLLEDISECVGHVNHSFAKYSSLVIESTRFGKGWPPARKQELDKINAQLVGEFEKLSSAEAQLLMLGEKTMEKTLRLYAARIALFRKQVYIGREDITEQEIAELKSGIMQLREQFYGLLSKRYDKLLAA